jgi:hypothetical protein
MTDLTRARNLCRLVARHYGLSDATLHYALQAASDHPGRAIRCYSALLASLTVERSLYPIPTQHS